MNTDHSTEERTPRHALRYRVATPRDGLAMWRLRRSRLPSESMSPFFYMSVLARLPESCIVAERAGEVVGYVVARRADARASVRVFDLTVDGAEDTTLVTAALLSRLVKLPANAGARFVDAERDAHQAVSDLLRLVGATGVVSAVPRNGACSAGASGRGIPSCAEGC